MPEWLERILSYEAGEPGDFLDLDWAGPPLLRVCEHLHPGTAVSDALKWALDGEVQITSGDYGPVMALSSIAVMDVVRGLRVVDVQMLQTAWSDDLADVSRLIGKGLGEPVGVGASLDEGGVEGEPVDDAGVEPRVAGVAIASHESFAGRAKKHDISPRTRWADLTPSRSPLTDGVRG